MMLNLQNEEVSFTIRAHESESFPISTANFIEKRLIDELFNEYGDYAKDPDPQREEFRKQIEMVEL